jgi:4-amino-4-deoxy-L-arabinose transferase-like glycosyltransferase
MSFFALEKVKVHYWIAAAILFALAALGKGPVAFAIPAMILSLWAWQSGKERMTHLIKIAACLCIAALITSTWYIAAYLQAPHEFIEKFWYENVSRFTGTMEDAPHKHSIFYLLGMLFVGVLPWSPYVLWVNRKKIMPLRQSFRTLWKNSSSVFQFSVYSAALIFLFYCIPSSKRSVYLLAAYPFIAIVLTNILSEYLSIKILRRITYFSVAAIILVQGLVFPLYVAPKSSERALAKIVESNLSPQGKVYSFGFEFYGASFYSKQLFLRLENAFQQSRRAPSLNDLVVCFDKESPAMSELLKTHSLGVTLIAETTLNKNSVKLFRVSQAPEIPPELTLTKN